MHEVQITLQTDQVTDIPVIVVHDIVWNKQWSDGQFREDWGGQSTQEGTGLPNNQELHTQLRSDLDFQQNTVSCFVI